MQHALMTVDDRSTRIGGHELFRGDVSALLAALDALVRSGEPRLVVTPNVDQVLMTAVDARAAEAFGNASLLLADGAPLVGLARLLGDDRLERHTGADLLQLVAGEAAGRGWRVAIAGGAPEIARAAAERLSAENPGAEVHAVDTPFLRSVDDPRGAPVADRLRALRPDVVFLCFGFPRQEAWWAHWRDRLPAALYIGAGAAVDFAAGAKNRAPAMVQRLGLEWCWRLAQEPRRLAHRYLVRGPRFAATVVRSLRHARRVRRLGAPVLPRVLHAVDSLTGGGAQQVLLDLATWSSSAGVPTAIVGAGGARADDIPPGVSFTEVRSGSFAGYLRTLLRVCRAFRPTVLHAHQRREALACLLVGRLLGIPVVEHAHTVLPNTGLRALSYRARRVFSVGPAVTRMLTNTFGVAEDRIATIGNLVPEAARSVGPDPRAGSPAAAPAVTPIHVLGVGRLEEQKDPLRFVEVLAAAGGRFRGRWLGEGPLRATAERYARELGAPAVFAGRSAQVPAEMDGAAALLITSRWEGTPLVVLEAFARGLLVVGFEAPGVTELLAGRGIVIPRDATPEEAAALVIEALGSDTSELIHAARAYAERHSDPDVVFQPVLAAYRELTLAGG